MQVRFAVVGLPTGQLLFSHGDQREISAWLAAPAPGALVRADSGVMLGCDDSPHAAILAGRSFPAQRLRLSRDGVEREAKLEVQVLPDQPLAVVTIDTRTQLLSNERFLAVATHELKSPIASLQLDLERLRRRMQHAESVPGAEVAREMERGLRQVTRLTRLMQNFIDASQMQHGVFALDLEEHDLCAIVSGAVESLAPIAARTPCTLYVRCGEPLPGSWDKPRIEQIVHNLVMNALQFAGSAGKITVDLARHEGAARLSVRDHGPGVPERERRTIFAPYARTSSRHVKQSLGLGLYVVREIVSAHHGRVWVEPTKGGGATFIVELPMRLSQVERKTDEQRA